MNDQIASDSTPRAPANSATLDIVLSERFGSGVGYSVETQQLDLRCTGVGYIWNTQSRFQSKQCAVTFHRDTSDRLADFAREHGLQGTCGSVEIAAGLESETFEDQGEKLALPPINIYLVLDDLAYNHTEGLLRSCLSSGARASLSVAFSHRNFARHWIRLDDIDLAVKAYYPIVNFSVREVLQENKQVRLPKHIYDPSASASLTLTARETEIQVSMWQSNASIFEIKLTGKLRSPKLGIVSDEETIEIKEYEADRGWQKGYPKEAFAGRVGVAKEAKQIHCWIILYATRAALTQLAALFSAMAKGDAVRLTVSVIAPDLPLAVGDRREFDVTDYTPMLVNSYA